MKKIITVSILMVMSLCLVACGGGDGGQQESEVKVAGSPLEMLNTIWASYADDEKFPVAGGDFSEENANQEGPGKYSIADGTALDAALGYPEASLDKIDDAASIMHMMNSNNLTCGVYHVKEGESVDDVATAIENNFKNRQWMCGFPDKMLIMTAGDYVVASFGSNELVEQFKTKAEGAYTMSVVCYDPVQ